jgi:hypothetical protein
MCELLYCEILDSNDDDYKDCCLVACDATQSGRNAPKFQRIYHQGKSVAQVMEAAEPFEMPMLFYQTM